MISKLYIDSFKAKYLCLMLSRYLMQQLLYGFEGFFLHHGDNISRNISECYTAPALLDSQLYTDQSEDTFCMQFWWHKTMYFNYTLSRPELQVRFAGDWISTFTAFQRQKVTSQKYFYNWRLILPGAILHEGIQPGARKSSSFFILNSEHICIHD